MTEYLRPGSTIGVIGGGYKTYLLLMQAHQMGFKTKLAVINNNDEAISGADEYVILDKYDYESMSKIADNVDTLIYQSTDIDNEDLEKLVNNYSLAQGTEIFNLSQDRYMSRIFLDGLNMNIAPFYLVVNEQDLIIGIKKVGYPCILKTIQKDFSNDILINSEDDLENAKKIINLGTYILEAFIDIEKSFSITLAKGSNGKIHLYPLTVDKYIDGNLINSTVFLKNDPRIEEEIQRVSLKIAQLIKFVGIMSVDFILDDANNLYVNDINFGMTESAHTYELATGYSQYEIQLRAIANWPIPEIFPLLNTSLLRIFSNQKEEVLKLLSDKSQWKFMFHNINSEYSKDTDIGYILVSSTEEDFLKKNVNDTGFWQIN